MLNLNELPGNDEGPIQYVMLTKDNKPICRTKSSNLPFDTPNLWPITKFRPSKPFRQSEMPRCRLYPEPEDSHQSREWKTFLQFLWKNEKVAVVNSECCDFYLLPSDDWPESTHAVVPYQMRISRPACYEQEIATSDKIHPGTNSTMRNVAEKFCKRGFLEQVHQVPKMPSSPAKRVVHSEEFSDHLGEEIADNACSSVNAINTLHQEKSSFHMSDDTHIAKLQRVSVEHAFTNSPIPKVQDNALAKNFVRTDPSYLRTLSQTHAGWIFGAIAELVDNSRDAKASRLDIFVEYLYFKKSGDKIPVLSIVDDGHGMSHTEIMRMLSFGHKQPEEDPDQIGRFGIGFKTGSMKLGRDVLVLTQTSSSRSVALLSQCYNENKEILEIPIITYSKQGRYMEVDLCIQSEECAASNLNAVKEFSPFNEYFIGEKFGPFGETGTGTQIYMWNLDEWGSNYILEWDNANSSGNTQQSRGDILIRSRRVRSRPGQISQKVVPLDYSLQAYLEVIFLNPRMKIYVQGSLVKSQPLAKCLNKTVQVLGQIMDREVLLTLGRSKVEWERMNCGMFLYWHGRLIEAYKRVGGQVHNADMGRGVIGVIDVTNLMDGGNGGALVLNNKQGFQDSEVYAKLEEWLGVKADEYWDKNFDILDVRKVDERYKPDHDWVQCNKCRKWRILSTDFDCESLPPEWFCYMPPFNGKCEIPEQQVSRGVITTAAKRSHHEVKQNVKQHEGETPKKNKNSSFTKNNSKQHPDGTALKVKRSSEDGSEYYSSQTEDDVPRHNLKRLRRGPSRSKRRNISG
ncbi:unnamed protein product [Musa banksii]